MVTTPSPSEVPYDSTWPAEWEGQRRSGFLLFSAVFLGLIALGFFTAALWEVTRANAVNALILLAMAVYAGHLTAIGFHAYGGGRPRTTTAGVREDPNGLVFSYGTGTTYLLVAFLAMTTIALILMAVLSASQTTTQGYVIMTGLVVMAIFTAVFLGVLLKLSPGQVVVGPDGVHHRGLTFTHFVPWEAVTGVVALWAGSPVIFIRTIGSSATVTRNYLGSSTPGPRTLSPFDTISGRWLASDPALLLQTLAHYIVHPADRPELGRGSALNRIATT